MATNDVGGQITVSEIEITDAFKKKTLDLKEVFVRFNIYEDLFMPFKSGKIILQDTNDLQVFLPLIGGETLNVTYYSANDIKPKNMEFIIYKLDRDPNVTVDGKNIKNVVLYFTSKEQMIDTNSAMSKHFNAKADSIIKTLLNKYLSSNKPFAFHPTDSSVELVANFWTPSKIIKFLSRSVVHQNHSDFVFFEDREGFNFKSVAFLMQQEPFAKLKFDDSLETKYNQNLIQRFTLSKYFDLMQTAKKGGFGNTVFQFDNEKYSFSKEEEDFESITSSSTSLGQNVQFHEDFKSNNNIITTYKNNRHIAKRDQLLQALDKYHMIIQLTGDSTKTIGQIFDITIRKKQAEVVEDNPLLTGTWLATNINHEITKGGHYTQNIKCVKNAFNTLNDTTKVKGKKNL
jgi:hypothetical protein